MRGSLSSIYTLSLLSLFVSVSNLLGEYSWRCICMSCVAIGVCMDACHAGEAIVARGRPWPAWCMDVCRNVDSFPFRQTFALPICPTYRRGHAEFFRRPCMCVHVVVLIFCSMRVQATMVLQMSSARIARYKKDAKADMIRCNRRQIRCPCRSCKLVRWIDPDSGQLEEHLLRRGFVDDHNHQL